MSEEKLKDYPAELAAATVATSSVIKESWLNKFAMHSLPENSPLLRAEAARLRDRFLAHYPEAAKYAEELKAFCAKHPDVKFMPGVHDELMVEVAESKIPQVVDFIYGLHRFPQGPESDQATIQVSPELLREQPSEGIEWPKLTTCYGEGRDDGAE